MAYAALASLAQTINLILNPHKYSVSVYAKNKIICIHDYAIFVLSFLEYFPAKANRFEGLITNAANEAEDILEYFMWNQIHNPRTLDVGDESGIEFDHQLEKATGEISSIAAKLMDIKKSLKTEDDGPISDSVAAVSSSKNVSAGENDVVIGLDDDLTAIKGRLCRESSKLEVISIVGMAGIGKTTLAKSVYDDAFIVEHFDFRVWVTLSQDYSIDETLRRLVDSMKLLEKNKSLMAVKVHKYLKGKRYLIVLDDMWSTKAWDDLMISFPDDHKGSRIMITTRLSDVAAYPISEDSPVHEMKFMDENQSWNLLQKKMFRNDQDCPPELEDIGKAIARACSGLPLAVVLVGGILLTVAKTRSSWEDIAKNVISLVDGQMEKILSLSYTHMPHHLRPCFLYIGGFPEDYEIHASRLVKLWVAEGFLKRVNGCKSLEERAEECLEDLVKRSLVLVTRRKATGEIKSCSLHDVVRESCIRKATEEKFLFRDIEISIKNKRRIGSICPSHFEEIRGPTIRTFLCLNLEKFLSLPASVGTFKLLRVLDVVCICMGVLPSQLFKLIHLRYLALEALTGGIPAAISNLQNLQTLIIERSDVLTINPYSGYLTINLPVEIWRMQQLRHLVFPRGYRLPNPVDGSTLPLENLQTLSWVTDLNCSEKMVKMIPNLKKLGLVYDDKRPYVPENLAQNLAQNLVHLQRLEKLKISNAGFALMNFRTPDAFPRTLKKLSLKDCIYLWKDMSTIGSLPLLQVLKLKSFVTIYGSSRTWETADGEFPELRYLLISKSDLDYWITESSHFPRLKYLVLHYCHSLQAIPDAIGDIATLETIDVDDVNQSLVESANRIVADQRDCGNDTLQLRCHHREYIGFGRYV